MITSFIFRNTHKWERERERIFPIRLEKCCLWLPGFSWWWRTESLIYFYMACRRAMWWCIKCDCLQYCTRLSSNHFFISLAENSFSDFKIFPFSLIKMKILSQSIQCILQYFIYKTIFQSRKRAKIKKKFWMFTLRKNNNTNFPMRWELPPKINIFSYK